MTKICLKCKTENSDRAKYCTGCRAELSSHRVAVLAASGTRHMTVREFASDSPPVRGTVAELPGRLVDAAPLPEGMEIGNWVLDRCLGKGGMGAVYLAHNRSLGNAAAIKALSPSLTGAPGFSARLQREGATQARLLHGNIARVFDFVEQDGAFYIVMEYVGGGSVHDLIKQRGPLDPAEALTIARGALAGLDYAHRQNIIHRDVTASNILLDSGVAKVTDFGIALIAGARRETSPGIAVGTPQYMSPEQIRRPHEIDARTDIYSMGIVLYEMLAGRVPFDADTEFDVKRAQITDAPPPLRSLNPAIPAGLETIVLKALEKDPRQRYADCAEFARALDGFEREPRPLPTVVVAPPKPKPDAILNRPQPRRHRWAAPAAVTVAAIALGAALWHSTPGSASLPDFSPSKILTGHTSTVSALAFSPDGKTLASGSVDNSLRLWSLATGAELPGMTGGYTNAVEALAFTRDGSTLVSGNQNATIKLWSMATRKEIRTIHTNSEVKSLALTPEGEWVIAAQGTDNEIGTWLTQFGTAQYTLTGHKQWVNAVAVSRDGMTFASGGMDGVVKLWSAGTHHELHTLSQGRPVTSVAFSPDGKLVASGGWDHAVQLWRVSTGERVRTLTGHADDVLAVAFSPDGKSLASASTDKTIKLWSVASGSVLQTLTGHTNWPVCVAFSPDGQTLASGGLDIGIRLWRQETPAP